MDERLQDIRDIEATPDLLERTLLAFYPRPDPEARPVAKKMLAVCVSGETPVNWDEIRRLACLPSFNVAQELEALRREVARELNIKD